MDKARTGKTAFDRTRVAVLGTLSHLAERPSRHDLDELERIVAEIQPDLLGVEVERAEFERGDLSSASLEVRDALVPLSRRSDVVLVPLGSASVGCRRVWSEWPVGWGSRTRLARRQTLYLRRCGSS